MEYELTILTEDKADEKIASLFEGMHYSQEYEGYKTLAYPINGNGYAHRYLLTLELSEVEARLLPKMLDHENWCLRYLLVKKDTSWHHNLIYEAIMDWAERELGADRATHRDQVELLTNKIEELIGE